MGKQAHPETREYAYAIYILEGQIEENKKG
jgi:hypothetical protein